MIALWLLSLAVAGGLAYAVGLKRGSAKGWNAAMADIAETRALAEAQNIAEAARIKHQNRSAGAVRAAATRRRNREARGDA